MMRADTAGFLLTGHVRRLVDEGAATAAAGAVIRGPDRAAAVFGQRARPTADDVPSLGLLEWVAEFVFVKSTYV
ncbi:hypothetical protein SSCG_01609 [Streptomyces clavuligerus]|nr:hypothetical protein [Streptomyces clavuligerus]EDY48581.1 hypothetical protein SSCG_01609 [Streptomyces clavuligerus]